MAKPCNFATAIRICFLAVVGLIACPATAEIRALLVGVSDYDNSLAIADLAGPPNDVRFLRKVLIERGASDITVLSDAVDGAARPTRAAILDGLARLARVAATGDLVYLHLSGHGTRQIDDDGDETDGLDEVFLPIDAARGASGSGVVGNALVDDEIGDAVAAIRATGADVWLVIDSCHSGTGMRAVGDTAVARFVDPVVFGIDTGTVLENPDVAPVDRVGDADLPGHYVAFYAAQSSELAYEVKLRGEAGEISYGLFTATLAARLQGGDALSYRQIFQAVLSDIGTTPTASGARAQTPLWEGNMIDAAVLGGSATEGVRQFQITGDKVAAGLLHGLAEGTLMALVGDAAAGPDQIDGFAQLTRVSATSSTLRHVSADCVPSSTVPCHEAAAPVAVMRFARPVARPVDLTLRLASPRDLNTGAPLPPDDPLVLALADAIDELAAASGPRIEISDSVSQLEVAAFGGALWFGPTVTVGDTPAGLNWRPGDAPLAALLSRMARAEEIAAMLGASDPGGSMLNRNPVKIEASVRSVHPEDSYPPDRYASIFEECGTALSRPLDAAADLRPGAHLKPCDQVYIAARGTRTEAYDVNRVHIDAAFCVHAAHERIEGRAPASGAITEDITMCSEHCPNAPQPAGHERMFVIVTKAADNAEPLNLTGMIETCESVTYRAVTGSAAGQFLADLSGGTGARAVGLRAGPRTVWVEEFTWLNMPRAEVYRNAGLIHADR